MSYWGLSDGGDATDTGKEFEVGGGGFGVIPEGSSVLAAPDEAKWADYQGDSYVQLRWSVLQPEEFANRKIYHKLWIEDDDPKAKDPAAKRDKAKRMLMAIDANAGGKLARSAKRPTDDDLALALTNKPMVLRLGVWDMDGKQGNWVQSVSAKNSPLKIGEAPPPKRATAAAKKEPTWDNEDSDIPF